ELLRGRPAAEQLDPQPGPTALARRRADPRFALQVLQVPEARHRTRGHRHPAPGASLDARPGGRDPARPDASCQRCRVLRAGPDGSDRQDARGRRDRRRRRWPARLHHRTGEWRLMRGLRLIGALAATALLVGGCSYDYLQRTDRVGYSAGDAVRANIERETQDPSKKSMYSTGGLVKDGVVMPGSG